MMTVGHNGLNNSNVAGS